MMFKSQQSDLSSARLDSLLETAADGIVVINTKGIVLLYNKACQEMFGYEPGEIIGQNVKKIMPSRYAHQHDDFLDRYLNTGEKKIIGIGREVEGQHKSGRIFPVELSVGEAETSEGKQFIGFVRDISRRRDAENTISDLQTQLVHMARVSAMDEMGAVIAHELNQPLSAIMLYLQALERSVKKQGEPKLTGQETTILEKAVQETSRAGAIIQKMRRFIERNEVDHKDIDLAQIVDESVEFASMGSRLRNISLRVEHKAAPLLAYGDAIEVSQIIVNLVRNAIDAMQDLEQGEIVVVTYQSEGNSWVEVTDTGPGIKNDILDKLFDAFISTKKKGLGIGLSIARTIARKHGGDLSAHNRLEGGAVFVLRLPTSQKDKGEQGV